MSAASKAAIAALVAIITAPIGAVISKYVVEAIENAKNSGGGTPSAADYWSALYSAMVKNLPCDSPASASCGGTIRSQQEYMLLLFAQQLSTNSAADASSAQAFETSQAWLSSEPALKAALTNVSNTGGIPSMIKYMESYTNPGASGAPLVIVTAQYVYTVAAFVYTS